jgi:RHS repeat-associated protein
LLTERTEEHSYIYAGGKLLRETVFIVDEQGSEIERTLDFRYDNAGLPYALHYTDTFEGIEQTCYYVTNLQGDVMYMVDESGGEVASYEYDPYGKLLRTTGDFAEINPLRYRGYYCDNDTDFYYLQSRYYDPAICRFICVDSYTSTGQSIIRYNMFAYCNNDPVNMVDTTGSVPNRAVMMSDGGSPGPDTDSEPYSGQANCYAYAFKLENDPRTGEPFQSKPQPGEFSGNEPLTQDDLLGSPAVVKKNINKRVLADADALGLRYVEVKNANHIAKKGNWDVALVYASDGSDYHWYRRNEDGTWSHKPGTKEVTIWDASGNCILDPATCDRGRYDVFVGYYEVGPN